MTWKKFWLKNSFQNFRYGFFHITFTCSYSHRFSHLHFPIAICISFKRKFVMIRRNSFYIYLLEWKGYRSSYRLSWIWMASLLLLLLPMPHLGGATMLTVSRRESTECVSSVDDCSCYPEPIEEDSCAISNTECSDSRDTCGEPCLKGQEVCGDSCLLNAIVSSEIDILASFQCGCDCYASALDCINECTQAYNLCACGSVSSGSSVVGYKTNGFRTSMVSLAAMVFVLLH